MSTTLRIIGVLFFALFFEQVNAQITITDTDLPSVNDTFRLSTTTDMWGIDPTLTGTNFTWDYSFLDAASQDFDTCVSIGSTPFAYQFFFNNSILYPNWKATYAVAGQGFTISGVFTFAKVYDYFKVQSSKFENVGFGAEINGIPTSVRKNPIELKCNLPLNYNDTYTNSSQFVIPVPGLGEYRQKMTKDAIVDGWGKVITPLDTFDVLRLKITVDITDSIYIDALGFPIETPRPTEIQYHYLAQGEDVPVLQVNTDNSDNITTMVYKDHPQSFIGIAEHKTGAAFTIYPNPANARVSIYAEEPIDGIQLYNAFGQCVYSCTVNNSAHQFTIPASCGNGIYIMEVKQGRNSTRQKLVIER